MLEFQNEDKTGLQWLLNYIVPDSTIYKCWHRYSKHTNI